MRMLLSSPFARIGHDKYTPNQGSERIVEPAAGSRGAMAAKAVVGLALAVMIVAGGAAYFTYTASNQLEQENARLSSQLTRLQANLSLIQGELAMLGAQRRSVPMVLLRTWGTALASYGSRPDGMTYLRLTETGSSSGVEAALASQPFNATIAGNSVQWSAMANSVATDQYHTIWPMVLENSPGGTNAIEFEMREGFQEVVVMSNGVRNYAPVHWNVSVPHMFKIVVVTPGERVNFYIDGVLVKSMTTDVPKVDFLLTAAEVKANSPLASGIATLDVYGGLLGGP